MNRGAVAAVLACLVTAPSARLAAEQIEEDPGPTPVQIILSSIRVRIDKAVIAQPPRLVPPTPIKLGWKLTKVATFDLGPGPLTALTAGDLDGDGKAELYAVTPREVIALAVVADKPRVLGRVAFSGDPAPSQPRDVVATIVVDGTSVIAAASGWQRAMRVSWQARTLVGAPADPGFLQCRGEAPDTLAPGRNYFGDATSGTYATRCTASLVDGDGYALRARAVLSIANKVDVAVERCAAVGLGCQPASRHEYAGVGTAFAVIDVDGDGLAELVYAAASAPGDADVLKIVKLGDDDKKLKLKKAITSGGIVGIVSADLDGNGTPETIVAVRAPGTPRVELWRVE